MHWTALLRDPKFDRLDQIFTHCDAASGAQTTFAVSALRRAADKVRAPLHLTPLLEEHCVLIMKQRGIEKPRLRRAHATTDYLPLLYLDMPDQTQLLVDGSHTYVARWMKGDRQALAYIVPQQIWELFTVEGLPTTTEEELLASFSGCPLDR